MQEIYLDNSASTKLAPEVEAAMRPFYRAANPSSLHHAGAAARTAVEDARKVIAASINAQPDEIVFTSGGTESNNLALKSYALANRKKGNHLIVSNVEHKCVMEACHWLETQGFAVTYLPVDNDGRISAERLDAAITEQTILVSVIHANNEVGTLNDLEKLGEICAQRNVAFHTDACQSYTKEPIDVKRHRLGMLTINSHKIHGPKGVGALYVKRGLSLMPLLHGGRHERGRRAGTENVAGIVGFAAATKLHTSDELQRMARLRDKLLAGLLTIPGTRRNTPVNGALCNIASVSFNRVEGEAIVGRLDLEGVCCSTGSACSEASLEPSYVLLAMGLTDEEANGSIRFSLSRETTAEEIDRVLAIMPTVIAELRALSPVGR